MKAVFSLAAKMAPTVVFLDEVDALLSRRDNDGREHSSVREMKLELMVQWDGIRWDSPLNCASKLICIWAHHY